VDARLIMDGKPPAARPRPVDIPAPDTMLMVFCQAPDEACARLVAEALVGERLAACVNILPGVQSVYRWQDEVQVATEVGLVIKTSASRFADMAARLRALHPYELPEIVAIRPDAVLPAYASWVIAQARKPLV
jgi:periplasmic divalent cation tolerance protein